MSLVARRMRTLGQVAAGTFDPIGGVAWTHAYWAEGAELLATSPTDGVSISTWPDETGTGDFTVPATYNGGLYIAAASELGNMPAVRFLAAAPCRMDAAWSVIPQPNTVVVVGAHNGVANDRDYIDSLGANRQLLDDISGAWRMFAGSTAGAGTPSSTGTKHIFIAYYNGASSTLNIDGTVYSPGNPGANGISAPVIGYSNNATRSLVYGFIGWKSGALTTTERDDLVAWARSHYGTP